MSRFLLLGLLFLGSPAFADATAAKSVRRSAAPTRVFLKPPKGFRPSDTVDRLADVLGSKQLNGVYRFHDKLAPRIGKDGPELEMHLSLIDSKNVDERNAAAHVLGFAKSYGFSIEVEGDHAAAKKALAAHGADHLVLAPTKN